LADDHDAIGRIDRETVDCQSDGQLRRLGRKTRQHDFRRTIAREGLIQYAIRVQSADDHIAIPGNRRRDNAPISIRSGEGVKKSSDDSNG
jgi:hypothetical protein